MRTGLLAWSLAVLLAVPACSTVRVKSDFDPQASFQQLKTYRWADRQRDGDPRVYNDIMDARVKRAVNRELQERGYVLQPEGEVDFLVGWHGSVKERFDVDTIAGSYFWGPGWFRHGWGGAGLYPSRTFVREWEEGTLVIDIADAKRKELVWRGSATRALGRDPPRGQEAQEKMNEVVEKILEAFPPKPED